MLNRLRWRLTLIYACTALLLLAAVGGSVYWMTVRYFRFATERALLERMTLEFEQLAAPLPPALQAYRPQQLPDERPVDNGTLASTFVFTIDQQGQVLIPIRGIHRFSPTKRRLKQPGRANLIFERSVWLMARR